MSQKGRSSSLSVRVSEIFYSLSGEGVTAGVPTVFVRLSGCSLRCGLTENSKLWCDTGYALSFEKGKFMTFEEILSKIEAFSTTAQVLLTGGEPLEGEEKRKICLAITESIWEKRHNQENPFTRIETNGKEDIQGFPHAVFTLDYKLPGSGMEKYMLEENFYFLKQRNNPLDEIKFVVRNKRDFTRALEVIHSWKLYSLNLLFSPVANEQSPTELAEWIKEAKLPNSRLSLQIHKILWGNKRGV